MLIKALEKEREKEREKARKEEREETENRLFKQFEEERKQFEKERRQLKNETEKQLIIKMYNKGVTVKEISDYADIPESEILKILDKQN